MFQRGNGVPQFTHDRRGPAYWNSTRGSTTKPRTDLRDHHVDVILKEWSCSLQHSEVAELDGIILAFFIYALKGMQGSPVVHLHVTCHPPKRQWHSVDRIGPMESIDVMRLVDIREYLTTADRCPAHMDSLSARLHAHMRACCDVLRSHHVTCRGCGFHHDSDTFETKIARR